MVKAQTDRHEAANTLKAMQAIAKNGSVTPAEVEAAGQRLKMADAYLKALDEKLSTRYSPGDVKGWRDKVAADKATVTAERVSWENAHILSPIAGTVYALPVNLYDFVPAGTDLLHVADLSHIEVRADFQEPDIGMLREGEPVAVTWEGQPGRTWHGHIVEKPMAVTRTPGKSVGTCLIALDDDHGELPLDTDAAVVATVEKHSRVLTIPRETLHLDGQAQFVYRALEYGHLHGSQAAALARVSNRLRGDDPGAGSVAGGVRAEAERGAMGGDDPAGWRRHNVGAGADVPVFGALRTAVEPAGQWLAAGIPVGAREHAGGCGLCTQRRLHRGRRRGRPELPRDLGA
jgi:hypothetical protein